MKKSFKEFLSSKKTIIDVAAIFFVGLLPLAWFKKNLLISWIDFDFPLANPLQGFDRLFYAWNNTTAPGAVSLGNFSQIPFQTFVVALAYFGVSLVTVEKIYFIVFLTSAGLSMYYLTSTLVQGERQRVAALTSAFFYMLNPFFMNIIWHRFLLLPIYAVLPLILALYIKGLRHKKFWIYVLLIGLVSVLASASHTNPVFSVAPVFIIFSYFLFYVLDKRKEKEKIIYAAKFTGFLALFLVGLNMWWLLPRILLIFQDFTRATAETKSIGLTNLSFLELNSRTSSLLNIFRLQGYWAFYDGYKGDPHYSYASTYLRTPFHLIGFLIPILAFASCLKKQKDGLIYFTFLAISGLFLIKGLQPPLGQIYQWIFEYIPFFEIFRNFYDKFGIIVTFSYAFLIGVSVSSFYRFLRNHSGILRKKIFAPIFLILISVILFVIYAFPMWNGEVIPKAGKITPSAHISIPDYYHEANNWIKSQKDNFNILPLPFPKVFYAAYKWQNGYWGNYPNQLFSKSIMSTNTGGKYNFPIKAAELIHKNPSNYLGETLALLNVKYVLLHRDTNWDFVNGNVFWISTTPRRYKGIVNSQPDIQLARSFGKLSFYRNKNYIPLHIYGSAQVFLTKDDFNGLLKTVSREGFKVGKTIILPVDDLNPLRRSYVKKVNMSNPGEDSRIKHRDISPTKHIVHVKSEKPFFLVFNESYNTGWKAYIRSGVRNKKSGVKTLSSIGEWFRKPLPEEKHFRTNGYANSWFIDKEGEYDVFLEFFPQRYFIWGIVISLLTLGVGLVLLFRKHKNRAYK